MDLGSIYSLIENYHVSREQEATSQYRRARSQALSLYKDVLGGKVADVDKAERYQICDLLRATEGLAYVFWKCHRRPISENAEDSEIQPRFKPKWALPDKLSFGGLKSKSVEAENDTSASLSVSEWLDVQASLRAEFPALIPWFRSDDEVS